MSASARPHHVVIETRDPQRAAAQAAALEAAGFTTTRCTGPDHEARNCPVLHGRDCDLLDEADAVLHDLDLRDPTDHGVLDGIRSRYPRLPVIVETSTVEARELRRDLERCTVVVPYSMEHVADEIAQVLADSAA